MLTIEDIKDPANKSGYSYVSTSASPTHPNSVPYQARRHSNEIILFRGRRRATPEESAQDYCDWVNGREVERIIPTLAPRERTRILVLAERKTGFPAAMRKAIIARDKVCQHCGLDFPYLQCDHIDPDGPHSLDNGQALCPNCHTLKTMVDKRGRELE